MFKKKKKEKNTIDMTLFFDKRESYIEIDVEDKMESDNGNYYINGVKVTQPTFICWPFICKDLKNDPVVKFIASMKEINNE